jgi:Flp pilus assembly pilin Flp
MSEKTGDVNQARPRHWMYGLNVALLVVIALVIIGFVMFLTASFKTKWDFTHNKMYSLSSYTQQLLKQVDQKGEKFQLINLYPAASEQGQEVDDLLEEYTRASKNVSVERIRTREDLEDKIRSRYKGEIEPYKAAVDEFSRVSTDLDKFSRSEGAELAGLAQRGTPSANARQTMLEVQGMFASTLPEQLSKIKRRVSNLTESTSPDWSAAVNTLKPLLDDVQKQIDLFADPAKLKEAIPPELAQYFEQANARYKAMNDELKKYLDQLNGLKPLKVEEIVQTAGLNTVVVMSPASVTVIDDSKVFKSNPSQQSASQQPTLSFEGEQAISSAILSVVQPDKVKVVFVTTSSHPVSNTQQDGWSDMADRLRADNFDVSEWSPPQAQPGQPPESSAPPAMGKNVVWIVFPPDPPSQQQMMMSMPPNPQAIIDELKKHLDQGGQALFLAQSGGGSPFSMGNDGYPYNDLLKPFGVWVQSKYTVVHNFPSQGGDTQALPRIIISRYPDTEITRPLQSLQSLLIGFPGQMGDLIGGPTVVSILNNPPANVEAQVIVESPKDGDTWATTNFSPTVKFDSTKDMKAPCPMAVSAVKGKGTPDEQRVVVIGSTLVGCNFLINDTAQMDDSGRISILHNPGNAELVNNSMLWLAGYKNMISVSSKSAAALRIRDISPAMMGFLRASMWAGLPILSLVLGGIVWLFRRR